VLEGAPILPSILKGNTDDIGKTAEQPITPFTYYGSFFRKTYLSTAQLRVKQTENKVATMKPTAHCTDKCLNPETAT